MDVYLTPDPAPEIWGTHAHLSFKNEQLLIHLSSDVSNHLSQVQKAARHVVSQGIKTFHLCGQDWSDEQVFAFHQGAFSARNRPDSIDRWKRAQT